jgi:hypothetical protein
MPTDFILICLLILIGLPVLQYDFRLVIIILILFLLIFQDKRKELSDYIYKTIDINRYKNKNSNNKTNGRNNNEMNRLNILYNEGTSIIKSLKKILNTYSKNSQSVYLSIKLTWKKFVKLSQTIMINKNGTYQHHLFITLVDQRKFILNQMSALIVGLDTVSLKESTLTKDRTLPLDNYIRVSIRKLSTVFDIILEIIKNNINARWHEDPYTENSPVEWNTPQAYNQPILDTII